MKPWLLAACCASVLFLSIVWEHVGRKTKSQFKPSVGITWLAVASENIWTWLGECWAWLCNLLDFTDFYISARELWLPLIRLFISWTLVIRGYVYYAYTTSPISMHIGCGILVLALLFVLFYFLKIHEQKYFIHVICILAYT